MDDAQAHLCVTYWWNGEADSGVDVKDMFIASASIENPLDQYWTLLWEAKVYVGETPEDYQRVYACPGIAWDNGEHFSIGLSAMIGVTGTCVALLFVLFSAPDLAMRTMKSAAGMSRIGAAKRGQ
jgi:hypothetical protein